MDKKVVTRNIYVLVDDKGNYFPGSGSYANRDNNKDIRKAEIYKTLGAAKAKVTTIKKWYNYPKYSIAVLECTVKEIINY